MSDNLNPEELQSLQTLTSEFNKIKTSLGDLELQKHGMCLRVENIKIIEIPTIKQIRIAQPRINGRHCKIGVIQIQYQLLPTQCKWPTEYHRHPGWMFRYSGRVIITCTACDTRCDIR